MTEGIGLRRNAVAGAIALATGFFATPAALAADAAGAQALARQNNCFRCHDVEAKKVGPAWKDVAVKYKGNKDAEATLVKHLTGGSADHPAIKAKNPDDSKNLVAWILELK